MRVYSERCWYVVSQEILKSESEYVRTELTVLQQKLRQLEERAFTIEKDIREAMATGKHSPAPGWGCVQTLSCTGDTGMEELLMQEHFKLLNEKNRIVKRQIELNLL